MNTSSSKCDPQLLRQSLEDCLSEQQEEGLTLHLEDCTHCQEALSQLAAGDEGWSKVESALRDEISGSFPEARGLISTLVPGNLSSVFGQSLTIGVDVRPSDFAVDFLEPPHEPDSLGRLNDIEIRSVIGHGGNGIVLKGYQKDLNRLVAVKVMAPQLAANAEARKRFAREAQATAAIVHPNVMPVLTVHSLGQLPYLVMPYTDCESLQERLDRTGSLSALDVLRIGHQVACGLAAAHAQGLVHRDVKPANILLERGVDRVRLTDFGLARAVDDVTLTRTGLIAGTPQYMSPEQARGDSVDTRSDLFSLGSVMYAMCTGRPPFRAETSYGILRRVTDDVPPAICELNPDIPSWLAGLINKLLAKDSESRFVSAVEIASILQQCIAHLQQPQSSPLPAIARELAVSCESGTTTLRRRPLVVFRRSGLSIGLTVSVFGTVIWLAMLDRNPATTTSPSDASGVEKPTPQLSAAASSDGQEAVAVPWEDGIDDDLASLEQELDDLFMDLLDPELPPTDQTLPSDDLQ